MSLIRNGKLCSENNGLFQSHGCCGDCCWRCCHSDSLIQFSDALMCFDYFLMPAISHSVRWWAFLGLRTEELLIFNCIFSAELDCRIRARAPSSRIPLDPVLNPSKFCQMPSLHHPHLMPTSSFHPIGNRTASNQPPPPKSNPSTHHSHSHPTSTHFIIYSRIIEHFC